MELSHPLVVLEYTLYQVFTTTRVTSLLPRGCESNVFATHMYIYQVAPNSRIHFWCFNMSSAPTDLEILESASRKSAIVTGCRT